MQVHTAYTQNIHITCTITCNMHKHKMYTQHAYITHNTHKQHTQTHTHNTAQLL